MTPGERGREGGRERSRERRGEKEKEGSPQKAGEGSREGERSPQRAHSPPSPSPKYGKPAAMGPGREGLGQSLGLESGPPALPPTQWHLLQVLSLHTLPAGPCVCQLRASGEPDTRGSSRVAPSQGDTWTGR